MGDVNLLGIVQKKCLLAAANGAVPVSWEDMRAIESALHTLRERDARIKELEDINARLAGNLQEPEEYSVEDALRIAKLWRAGKMIGGDPQGVINALLTATESAEQALAEWQSVTAAVVRELSREDPDSRGNAPGHAHEIPGIWDSDNGPIAGAPCAWCLAWNAAKKLVAAKEQP